MDLDLNKFHPVSLLAFAFIAFLMIPLASLFIFVYDLILLLI